MRATIESSQYDVLERHISMRRDCLFDIAAEINALRGHFQEQVDLFGPSSNAAALAEDELVAAYARITQLQSEIARLRQEQAELS